MRVLVTGAGGYIGSVLVPMLLAEGHQVRAIDRFFFGNTLSSVAGDPGLEVIREDTRVIGLPHLKDIDAIVDLVAISNDPSGEEFSAETYAINWRGRVNTASLAKLAGVKRYILPSSCSIYGFQAADVIADETTKTNALTTYSKANERAEKDILPLADESFCVVALRQATVYGLSPRMRLDLAINGMTYGAFTTGQLPLMRDGSQWRPMLHVKDAARAQIFMLTAPSEKVSGQIFNVGSAENVYQLGKLAGIVAENVQRDVEIVWYGDADVRSYRASFDKIEALGYRAQLTAKDGVREISDALANKTLEKTPETITLDWYRHLEQMFRQIRERELHGGMLRL